MQASLHSLRSWRSTIYAPSPRESVDVVSRSVESPASISQRQQYHQQQQQQHYESSVSELRRRLARKASTFSLRGKSRRSERYLRGQQAEQKQQLEKAAEAESETSSVETVTQVETGKVENAGPKLVATTLALPQSSTLPAFCGFRFHRNAPYPRREPHATTVVSMASEASPPPVPFARLTKIATEACDETLAPASSYEHASTALWNQSIINTILQRLVTETTTDTQTQPQYKYIVNSTIIQHAAGTGADAGGRRGMHAASGAYWNNEKDGMWSFKYESAEGKGLDVVVGIVWVWIG